MSRHALLSDRRRFLALTGGTALATALGSVLTSPAPAWADPRFPENPFTLGVASGEPTSDGIVLWTRLALDPTAPDGKGGMPERTLTVYWQVAEDSRFRRVVRAGAAKASPQLAHSVHVEVRGLRADREYWYRFRVGKHLSTVGRTRTAPAPNAALRSLDFAFASCQNMPEGF
ncbi:MAG TPA: PhoD-like phosphatase N-terminal domain-containing protein, partial [Actinopolymorphaceae bacterium]